MSYQNINQYNYRRLGLIPFNQVTDFCLASDEKDYDQEVIFSPYLIAEDNGNRMPLKFDFNSTGTTIAPTRNEFLYDTIVSENYYNPTNIDPNFCVCASTLCDVGLTGIDNGLTLQMSGVSIDITTGLYVTTGDTYNRYKYDRRFKMHPITGSTTPANRLWNDNSYNYNLSWSNAGGSIGTVATLNGGFFQGFFKLQGYDYDTFPVRTEQGWTAEFLLKYRWTGDTNVGLNNRYPNNKGTFFYLGSRAENKFYHYPDGSPKSDSGYTRVTSGLTCMKTCHCHETGFTNSGECIHVYQLSGGTSKNCSCGCACQCEVTAKYPELDPLYDGVSNGMSVRLSGDTGNPRVCVKEYLITGSCITTGTCETGTTFVTGTTVIEWCSTKGIFDGCESTTYPNIEHWVQIDVVFRRNDWLDCRDQYALGGLGQLVFKEYTATTANNSVSLIEPPITHNPNDVPVTTDAVIMNDYWIQQRKFRLGKLYVYVNGKQFMIIDDFEEIVTRPLNTYKEKQIGVPYNISLGGGTQGLKDNLTFSGGCPPSLSAITYQQDPECLTDYDLEHTIYSGLTTQIHLEEIFGGSFIGDISAFRMYTEPLNASQIHHNFRLLKNKYDLLDVDCKDCTIVIPANDFYYIVIPDDDLGYILIPNNDFTYETIQPTPTPTNTPTNTPTPSVTSSNTPTPTVTPTVTPTNQPSPSPTPTPTSIPYTPGDFTFDADYIVLTYSFTDGDDLDTRTRVTVPNIGQTAYTESIGWCCQDVWPASGEPILTWGGDNTGVGFESTLIDLIEFKNQYPGENTIVINSKAFWYGTLGNNPVTIRVTLYKGGTMVADPENYTFYNDTFTAAYGALSPGSTVTTNLSECIEGENITSLQYNLVTFNGTFI